MKKEVVSPETKSVSFGGGSTALGRPAHTLTVHVHREVGGKARRASCTCWQRARWLVNELLCSLHSVKLLHLNRSLMEPRQSRRK